MTGMQSRAAVLERRHARDCRVSGSLSSRDSTSPVDKAARDCRVSGSLSSRDSTSPVDTPVDDTTLGSTTEIPVRGEERTDGQCSDAGGEASTVTEQPPEDASSSDRDADPGQHADSAGIPLLATAEPVQQVEQSEVRVVNVPGVCGNSGDGCVDANATTNESVANDAVDSCASESDTSGTPSGIDRTKSKPRSTNSQRRRLRSAPLTAAASDRRQMTLAESM
eukprot:TRINITY_DN56884_c0_g1_i10.p1 TRINITY_DN56884_c0_g1~~TRINITY_DN56884_c0_g1_i10.p1  ORF type:complete len:223 (+),score=44.00 TRINITY_DN56884_c0_g1_i10:271-939(+)